jgi:ribonuclease HI
MSEDSQNNKWKRMSFKGNKVWAEIDESGNLKVKNGKVLIKYNLKQNYQYLVKTENLLPESQAVPGSKSSTRRSASKKFEKKGNSSDSDSDMDKNLPDKCIRIYTDGASSGNPGPAGIGILLIYGENRKEISSFIGRATNNIAELTAVKVALQTVKKFELPVRIFSDSSYVIGVLTKNWKAKANQELIMEIKKLMRNFQDISFIKVKGHAGIKENEVADFLATSAIKKGLS